MKLHLQSKYDRTCVYHFTDKSNIAGIIEQGGLLPRSMLTSGFTPGGNDWSIQSDDRLGMNKYVHLCFLEDHPMKFLIEEKDKRDLIWLQISLDVLDIDGVKYCTGVSNAAGATYLDSNKAIKRWTSIIFLNGMISTLQKIEHYIMKQRNMRFLCPKRYHEN